MKAFVFWPVWLLGFFLAAYLGHRVNPLAYEGGRSRDDEERLRRNSSAIATMIGEFRTSMSDILFIKTERYLHAGVAYVPHSDEAVMTAEQLSEEVDEHQDELGLPDDSELDIDASHAGTPTLIPTATQDFRGFIGWLHREVKPWRDPARVHIHTDGRELLPWFRVMALVDPQHVRGFVAGGFWLQAEDLNLAIDFINEGLSHNPEAFQLYVSRGFLMMRQQRRTGYKQTDERSRDFIVRANRDFARAAELALRDRPDEIDEDGFGPGGWTGYHEGDAMSAANMHVVTTRLLGDLDESRRLAGRYLEFFPNFNPLRNALNYE